VPGAVQTIQTYFTNVASALPQYDIGTYLFFPTADVNQNYLILGHWENGEEVVVNYDSTWESLPAANQYIGETYRIQMSLRVWSGEVDPLGRLTDAFTILDSLRAQFVNDPGGSGQLSPSGSWGKWSVSMPTSGPLGQLGGWGIVLAIESEVINVRI
jgi:hypothetical protein